MKETVLKNNRIETKNLLKLVAEDNRMGFNMFYDLYYDQVFNFAYYFLKDTEACREVASDTFYAVWKSRLKLKDIENIETYLFIVVRNESTHYLERISKQQTTSLEEQNIQLEYKCNDSPEDNLITEEMEVLLSKAVDLLPEKCRLIFLLARQEGLNTKEIAQRLSISESTVRVQMKIAIQKIATTIKPHFPDLSFTLLLACIW